MGTIVPIFKTKSLKTKQIEKRRGKSLPMAREK